MEVIPVGRHAALVEVDDAGQALSLALWVRERVAATDVVPAARTVLVDGLRDLEALVDAVAGWRPGPAPVAATVVEVTVTYDGPDLALVGRAWGIAADEVPGRHAAREYVVAFCGFAPGFAYLTPAEPSGAEGPIAERDVPRRSTPRSRVPPGSVAVAGRFTGIYPTASPGGWQLLGTTDATLWDQAREEPALLPPGTRVRLVPR